MKFGSTVGRVQPVSYKGVALKKKKKRKEKEKRNKKINGSDNSTQHHVKRIAPQMSRIKRLEGTWATIRAIALSFFTPANVELRLLYPGDSLLLVVKLSDDQVLRFDDSRARDE